MEPSSNPTDSFLSALDNELMFSIPKLSIRMHPIWPKYQEYVPIFTIWPEAIWNFEIILVDHQCTSEYSVHEQSTAADYLMQVLRKPHHNIMSREMPPAKPTRISWEPYAEVVVTWPEAACMLGFACVRR